MFIPLNAWPLYDHSEAGMVFTIRWSFTKSSSIAKWGDWSTAAGGHFLKDEFASSCVKSSRSVTATFGHTLKVQRNKNIMCKYLRTSSCELKNKLHKPKAYSSGVWWYGSGRSIQDFFGNLQGYIIRKKEVRDFVLFNDFEIHYCSIQKPTRH